MNASHLIQQLQLQPHPEGGYYRETYRSVETLTTAQRNTRNVSTAIYYLLEDQDKSVFHRIQSDELWFFHQGKPLEIVSIRNAELVTIILGNDVTKNQVPQAMIAANTWFAARVKDAAGYSLVSCTVAPGFEFSDFELANRKELLELYPKIKDTIERFTR